MDLRPPDEVGTAIIAWMIGELAAIGQALMRPEFSWRCVLGAAFVGGPLGIASYAITVWLPEAPWYVILGVAGSFAVAGKELTVEAIRKWLKKK